MGTMAGDGAGLEALLELLTRAAGLRQLDPRAFAAQLLPAAKAYWAEAKDRGINLGAITPARLVDQRHDHRNFNDSLAYLDAHADPSTSGTPPAAAAPAAADRQALLVRARKRDEALRAEAAAAVPPPPNAFATLRGGGAA